MKGHFLFSIPQLHSSIWGVQGTRRTTRLQTVESPKHGSKASGAGWWRSQCLGDKTFEFHHCPLVVTKQVTSDESGEEM